MDGSVKWKKAASLDSAEDSAVNCLQMEYPAGLSDVHFVRLTLSHGEVPFSKNLYMRGAKAGDYRAIRQLTKANVRRSTETVRHDDQWHLTTQLHNMSAFPALMVRLKVVRAKSGDRILPVIYEDNYFTLMPGEQRTIQTDVSHADTRGEVPRMEVGGFNVKPV
jgi:hypothetical protein